MMFKSLVEFEDTYENLAAARARARYLNPLTAYLLKRKGRRDGRLGLPKDDGAGLFISPFVREQFDSAAEFDARQWLRCEGKTARLHIEARGLLEQIVRLQQRMAALQTPQAPEEGTLKQRFKGEDGLNETIIRQRRLRAHQAASAQAQARAAAMCAQLEEAAERLSELQQTIAEYENIAKLRSEHVYERTRARVAAYWQGLFQAPTQAPELPPLPPPVEPRFSGETAYRARHRNLAIAAEQEG